MKFPLIGIKKNDYNIYIFSSHIGIISKGGDVFYKDLWICDSEGNSFFLKESYVKGKAPFKYSLMYFQQMYEMSLTFEKSEFLTLENFKKKIIQHILKNRRKWILLSGSIEDVCKEINESNSYKEIMKIFD